MMRCFMILTEIYPPLATTADEFVNIKFYIVWVNMLFVGFTPAILTNQDLPEVL